MRNKQGTNCKFYCDRKSIARSATYRQSLHLRAVQTGEALKGWNKGREIKQPQDCSEKSHNTNCDN